MTPDLSALNRTSTLGRGFGYLVLAAFLVMAPNLAADSAPSMPPKARLVASSEPGWPQFRGPRRDGVSDEVGLMGDWPQDGPPRVWRIGGLGRGYSSPVIAAGRLFITGEMGESLRVFALDLEGNRVWQADNGRAWRNEYPGARASVTFHGGRLFHLNAHGRVACLDAETGREDWAVDILDQFGGKNITWGLSECLLVTEREVFVTVGGREALFVALNKADGSLLWKSPALIDSQGEGEIESASYASPILVESDGRRWIVGCSLQHLFCIDAATGQRRWVHPKPTRYKVLAMTPVLVDDAVFMTAPHGEGGGLYPLEMSGRGGGEGGAAARWRSALDPCQGGVVRVEGNLYGAFYSGRKGWAAVDVGTGVVRYSHEGLAKGAPLWADGRLYVQCEDGWVVLLEPGVEGFQERGRFRWADAARRDAWAHPVICEGRLYTRYHEELVCHDVRVR